MPERIQRIAHLMKQVIEEIITKDIQDQAIGFHAITDIQITKDLSTAKVFFSIFGQEEDKQKTFKALCKNIKEIRYHLAHKISLRKVPQLRFILDDSLERGDKILRKLKEIEKKSV